MKELIAIQSELKAPKNLFNKFGGYRYRNLEGILEALKPLLKEQKCQLTLEDDVVELGFRVYVKATATITNDKGESVSTSAYAREAETKKGMDDSQITGTASSYARKYACNGLFLIDDTKDADTDEYHNEVANKQGEARITETEDEYIDGNAAKTLKEMIATIYKIDTEFLDELKHDYGFNTATEVKRKDYPEVLKRVSARLEELEVKEK